MPYRHLFIFEGQPRWWNCLCWSMACATWVAAGMKSWRWCTAFRVLEWRYWCCSHWSYGFMRENENKLQSLGNEAALAF